MTMVPDADDFLPSFDLRWRLCGEAKYDPLPVAALRTIRHVESFM
jgi:hypothetical protein